MVIHLDQIPGDDLAVYNTELENQLLRDLRTLVSYVGDRFMQEFVRNFLIAILQLAIRNNDCNFAHLREILENQIQFQELDWFLW